MSSRFEPFLTALVRLTRYACGCGPVRYCGWPMTTGMVPPTRVTEPALPDAVMLSSRSGAPLLTSERNRLADWPGCRVEPSGAPSTNTFPIEMLPTTFWPPSTDGWKFTVGAALPASQPASRGIAAADTSNAVARCRVTRALLITAGSPRAR